MGTDIRKVEILEANFSSVDESEWIPGPRPRQTRDGRHEVMIEGQSDEEFVHELDRQEREKTEYQVGVAGGYAHISTDEVTHSRFLVETMRVDLPVNGPFLQINDYMLEAEIEPTQNIHSIKYRRVTKPRVVLRTPHCPYCASGNIEPVGGNLYFTMGETEEDTKHLFASAYQCHDCVSFFALDEERDGPKNALDSAPRD